MPSRTPRRFVKLPLSNICLIRGVYNFKVGKTQKDIENYSREPTLKQQTYFKYSSLGRTRLIPVTFSYFR